jgi:hypothetical protein
MLQITQSDSIASWPVPKLYLTLFFRNLDNINYSHTFSTSLQLHHHTTIHQQKTHNFMLVRKKFDAYSDLAVLVIEHPDWWNRLIHSKM